jgi:hypothetical protein
MSLAQLVQRLAVMRTGTRSLRGTSLALPLGVLGGTALLATALVWGRRRSSRERALRATPTEGTAVSEEGGTKLGELAKPAELENRQGPEQAESLQVLETESRQLPDDEEGGLDALSFGENSDSLAGESYDSVNPDDAGREWLLRATETQSPPRESPETIDGLDVVLLSDDVGIDDQAERQAAAQAGLFQEEDDLQEDLQEELDFQEEAELEEEVDVAEELEDDLQEKEYRRKY